MKSTEKEQNFSFPTTKHKLVIAEKPSVAMSIAAVIGADERKDGYMEGGGYIVSWCVGHLAGLADATHYGDFKKWRYEDLPILPQTWETVISPDKEEQFETLKNLMHRKDVTGLVCATDAGREGELIFRFVYEKAGCEKPFRRLWISSMEESAIRKGFDDLRDGHDYDPLYHSALCRAKADWLIGINATRLFSVLYNHTLNVGRVQTPTLSLLVERDNAIANFQKKKYYVVRIGDGTFEAASPPYTEKDEAEKLRRDCDGETAVCTSLIREEKTENPPRLYDLTTLQREANRLYGYTAKQTLDYTQSLYEKKLCTYPRTDSQYLTDDMLPTAENIVSGLFSTLDFAKGTDLSPDYSRILNSKKVSDHHAIIPTAEAVKTDKAVEIGEQQKKRVDPMYHEKIDSLVDTYARKLAENMNNSFSIEARVPSILITGGSNFPVRKKEKQNAARDRNMEDWNDIQGLLDKIRSTGMGGISADDPQAIQKLVRFYVTGSIDRQA